jgi:hypothetical protein
MNQLTGTLLLQIQRQAETLAQDPSRYLNLRRILFLFRPRCPSPVVSSDCDTADFARDDYCAFGPRAALTMFLPLGFCSEQKQSE